MQILHRNSKKCKWMLFVSYPVVRMERGRERE